MYRQAVVLFSIKENLMILGHSLDCEVSSIDCAKDIWDSCLRLPGIHVLQGIYTPWKTNIRMEHMPKYLICNIVDAFAYVRYSKGEFVRKDTIIRPLHDVAKEYKKPNV